MNTRRGSVRLLLVLVLASAVTVGAATNGRPALAFQTPAPVKVPVLARALPYVARGAGPAGLIVNAGLAGFYGGTAYLEWKFGPKADERFTSGSPDPARYGWNANDLPPVQGLTSQGSFNLVYFQQQPAPGRYTTASVQCIVGPAGALAPATYPYFNSGPFGTNPSATGGPGTWGGGGFSTSSNACPVDVAAGKEGIGEVRYMDHSTGELLIEWSYSSPQPWSTQVTRTCRDAAGVEASETFPHSVPQTTPGTALPNIALPACPAGSHVVQAQVTGGRQGKAAVESRGDCYDDDGAGGTYLTGSNVTPTQCGAPQQYVETTPGKAAVPAEMLPLVPPQRSWSPEAEGNYPACSVNSGGAASCELAPRVDGVSCLSGIDCSGWLQRSAISCTWGSYAVSNAWCAGEPTYEPMLTTGTSTQASPAPSPASSPAASPAPSPQQSIVPGSNSEPVLLGPGTTSVTNADGSTTTQTSRVNPDGSTTTTTRTTNADGTQRSQTTTVTNVPLGGINPGGQGAGEAGGEGCLSSNWSWNPLSWVFAPVKCALLWAFKPSPGAMAQWTIRINGFKQRPPVSLVTGGVVFIGGFVDAFPPMTSTACGGGGNGGPVFRDMSGSIAVDPVDVAGDLVEMNAAACAVWWVARVAVWVGGLLLIYHRVLGSVGGKT